MTVTETLAAIKAEMSAKGWDDGGAPKSVKRDASGNQIATWGSPEYMSDLDDARDTIEAREALAELNRRL